MFGTSVLLHVASASVCLCLCLFLVMCQHSIVLPSLFIMWLASKGEEKGDVIFLKARP